jgi:hypothetical protein
VTAWPTQPDSRTCGPSCVVVAERLPAPPPDPWPGFAERVHDTHRRINGWWPRALGTPPWAVARELGGRVRRFRAAEVAAALPHPVPVYLGSRWLPRHVVLALEQRDDGLWIYDPARGAVVPMASSRWRTAWFAVLPA